MPLRTLGTFVTRSFVNLRGPRAIAMLWFPSEVFRTKNTMSPDGASSSFGRNCGGGPAISKVMASTGAPVAGSVVELNSGRGVGVAVGRAWSDATDVGEDGADEGWMDAPSALESVGAAPPHAATDQIRPSPMTRARENWPSMIRFRITIAQIHSRFGPRGAPYTPHESPPARPAMSRAG